MLFHSDTLFWTNVELQLKKMYCNTGRVNSIRNNRVTAHTGNSIVLMKSQPPAMFLSRRPVGGTHA